MAKKQIKDTNVIQTPDVEVNPIFFVPDDVIDIKVKDEGAPKALELDFSGFGMVEDTTTDPGNTPSTGSTGGTSSNLPDPPDSVRLVSQNVKFGPDGTQLVDIVIEWDAVPNAVDYEVRYSEITA
jgi:hypothetical protein